MKILFGWSLIIDFKATRGKIKMDWVAIAVGAASSVWEFVDGDSMEF